MFFSSESLLFCFAFFSARTAHSVAFLPVPEHGSARSLGLLLFLLFFLCCSVRLRMSVCIFVVRGTCGTKNHQVCLSNAGCILPGTRARVCVYANGVRMVCFRLAVFLILPLPNGDPLPLPCHGVCLSLRLDFNAKGREGVRVHGKTPVSPAFLGSCMPVPCCVETLKGFVLFYHFVLGFQKQFHLSAGKNMISFYFLSLKRILVVLFWVTWKMFSNIECRSPGSPALEDSVFCGVRKCLLQRVILSCLMAALVLI